MMNVHHTPALAAAALHGQLFAGDFRHERSGAVLSALRGDALLNRLTPVFEDGTPLTYRFRLAGQDAAGATIRFCWSLHRNAAGFYLAWRERLLPGGHVERSGFTARSFRKRCKQIAEKRARRTRASRPPLHMREAH